MKIGIIGLGKMGSRIAEKLVKEGHEVTAWNRSREAIDNLKFPTSLKLRGASKIQNLKVAKSIEDLVKNLDHPRIVWLMLPAGEATQTILDEVVRYLEPGDIVIDGANANYLDTERRSKELKVKSIRFLGIGVSGGVIAEREGYPMMVGGDYEAYCYVTPLLNCLAKPSGGHAYFGTGGAGHFVKMVHNGIEYGMMQAIGEGFGVLQKSDYKFDLFEVSKLWQKGTIISSFLIDRARDVLEKNTELSDIVGIVNATGEAEWTINEAKKEKVPVPVIEESLKFRIRSQKSSALQNSFAAKMVAALRREFGGHDVKRV